MMIQSTVSKKCLIAILMMFILLTLIPNTAYAATVSLQTWDLVDDGKHLDYDGDSAYMSYITSGASVWNNYKSGVIRPDSGTVIQDVYCTDSALENGSVLATTYSFGSIIFFTKEMATLGSVSKIKNVAIHELGHCLRLDHNTSTTDIMYPYVTTTTTLSANDKLSYDSAYLFYY